MKILRVWLIAICLSSVALSAASELDSKITEFAHSPEWLGHFFYEGDPSGYTSLVESNHYFFTPTGKYNPEDELKETIRRLSVDEEIPEEQYCHYVGRFELVLSVFPEYRKASHVCKAFNDWSQKLNLETVRLSFAAGYIKNPASSFGHLFLKLVSKNQKSDLLNYGINFSAQTGNETGAMYALKGLFGQYPGGFVFLPFHQLIRDYSDLEGRDIWELDLKFDEIAKKRLLMFVYEFDSNYVDYTFLNKNCAGILEKLIFYVQRRPLKSSLQLKPWTIPLESFMNIASGINEKEYYYRPSLKTQLQEMEKRLSELQKNKIKVQAANQDFDKLDVASLDYVILDKKIHDVKLNEDQYLKLLTTRSRLPVGENNQQTSVSIPTPKVDERSRMSSVGIVGTQEGAGLDLNFLNEKLIYRNSLSEINILNFHFRTSSEKKPILENAEIFNFLAGESISFLRSPLSYGGGVYYQDKKEISINGNIGFMLKGTDWIYFPKLNLVVDKFHSELHPEVDIFYFTKMAHFNLSISPSDFGLDILRFFNRDYSVQWTSIYNTPSKEIRHSAGISYFY